MNLYVFKRHGVPLLLLPTDKKVALKTLQTYLPQTTKAKLVYHILSIAIRLNFVKLLLKQHSLSGVAAELCKIFNEDFQKGCLGFLVCNPDHGDRVIAVKRDGSKFSIIKATTIDKKTSIQKEFDNISKFNGILGIPKVISTEATDKIFYFEMPYYKKANNISIEDKRIHELLLEWRKHKIIHGDFAPWNLRETDSGELVAIDWEWAEEKDDSSYDLIYAIKRIGTLVNKISEDRIDEFVKTTISQSKWMEDFVNNK